MAESIQKTFEIPGDSQLVVENIKGPITVTGWDRPQIEVTATPEQDWAEIEIEQHDNKVVARTKTEHDQNKWLNWFNGSRSPHVEYSVKVPYTTDLEIKNVEGPITVRHCKGKIRINNVEGKVKLDHAEGDIRAETVNGALAASHVHGAPQFKTVNGKLRVQESELSGLSAHTVNGKIKAAATWAADAQISLHTVNGDCELTVPSDFRAKASAHGINVSVTLGKAETITRQFSGWHGAIGPQAESDHAPQAQIAFHTVNGHLRIDDSAPAAGTSTAFAEQAAGAPEPVQAKVAPAPAEAPAEEEPPKSQLDILQMVERGEMTVEEALEILEA
jgi:DUF4097 and DUF4098 domain-containing protein YvlB